MPEREEKPIAGRVTPEQIDDAAHLQAGRLAAQIEGELAALSLLEREALACPRCGEPLGIRKLYHIFTHGQDEWLESFDEAMRLFNRWSAENDSARLYEEYYWCDSDLADDLIREDCLLAHGPYPG